MGNCSFPREQRSRKWFITREEWEDFVNRYYTKDHVDNDKVDMEEVRKGLIGNRKGPWEITGHRVWIGEDFITFGQLMVDAKQREVAQRQGREQIPGKFDGHDYLFGNKTSVGCASATHTTIHNAELDEELMVLKVVLSQPRKPPKTLNIPVPADMKEEVKAYIRGWGEFMKPLRFNGEVYTTSEDYRRLWGTLILMDVIILTTCLALLMTMDPMFYGDYGGAGGDYGGADGGGDYGSADAGEGGLGGFMLF